MSDAVLIRPMVPDDLAFVYRNWLADLRDADRSALPNDLWYPAHREAISRVLADPAVTALVVCPSDSIDEILGFAVAEQNVVLHWVFLRKELRGRQTGLVPMLLTAVGAAPGTPAAWQHPSGRALQNPPRSRWARARYASTSTEGSR